MTNLSRRWLWRECKWIFVDRDRARWRSWECSVELEFQANWVTSGLLSSPRDPLSSRSPREAMSSRCPQRTWEKLSACRKSSDSRCACWGVECAFHAGWAAERSTKDLKQESMPVVWKFSPWGMFIPIESGRRIKRIAWSIEFESDQIWRRKLQKTISSQFGRNIYSVISAAKPIGRRRAI